MQVRRQARTALDRRQVARGDHNRRPDSANAASRLRAPASPGVHSAAKPVAQSGLFGSKPQSSSTSRFGHLSGAAIVARTVERARRRHMLASSARQNGRVDLVRRAARRWSVIPVEQVIAVVANEIEPLRHRAFGVAPPRLVMAQTMHRRRTVSSAISAQFLVTLSRAAGSVAIPWRAGSRRALARLWCSHQRDAAAHRRCFGVSSSRM